MSIASNVSCDSPTLASVEPAVAAATVPSLTTGTRVANGTGRWSRRRAVDIVAAVDLAAAVMAGILPALILDLGESATLDWRHIVQASIVGAVLTLICLTARNTFDPARIHDFAVAPKALLCDIAIGVCPVSGLALPSGLDGANWWLWHAIWIGAGSAFLVAIHAGAHVALISFTAAGRFDRRVAIFGAGPIALRLHDYIAGHDHGVRFAGLYDDRGIDRVDTLGLTIAGKLSDMIEAARGGGIDQIVIALPQLADRRIADIAQKCDGLPATVHIVTHLASDIIGEVRATTVSRIGPVGLLDIYGKRASI